MSASQPTSEQKRSNNYSKGQWAIPITNVTRIRNDRGPLPLTPTNPELVNKLITNGSTMGFIRYRVEGTKTECRPSPCRTCLLYYYAKQCLQIPACFKYGNAHQSATCKVIANKSFCASFRAEGHQTAAANRPLRPKQGIPNSPEKYTETEIPVAPALPMQTSSNQAQPPLKRIQHKMGINNTNLLIKTSLIS